MLRAKYERINIFMEQLLVGEQSSNEVELVLGNSNSNFSGVTSTMLQVLSIQKSQLNTVVLGNKQHLDDPSLYRSFWQVAKICRKPLSNGNSRIFHARRVDEMIQALLLKHFFGAKFKIVFSSAAQRKRSRSTVWLTQKMDAVIAMSKASAKFLEVKPDEIIYHGIQSDVYQPALDKVKAWKSLGFPGEYGIGILGRVRKQKGVHLFVNACIENLKQHPNATAIVVGATASQDQAFANALKEKVEQAGLSERIIFTGEQNFEDIPKIFSALSIVAALSDNEGFGLTIPEAMSCEAAVLATEAGAWPEIIRQGVDGYVVPINNQQAVTQKLALMMEAPEKLTQMGKSGRQRILDNYTVEREAQELVSFFHKLQNT